MKAWTRDILKTYIFFMRSECSVVYAQSSRIIPNEHLSSDETSIFHFCHMTLIKLLIIQIAAVIVAKRTHRVAVVAVPRLKYYAGFLFVTCTVKCDKFLNASIQAFSAFSCPPSFWRFPSLNVLSCAFVTSTPLAFEKHCHFDRTPVTVKIHFSRALCHENACMSAKIWSMPLTQTLHFSIWMKGMIVDLFVYL